MQRKPSPLLLCSPEVIPLAAERPKLLVDLPAPRRIEEDFRRRLRLILDQLLDVQALMVDTLQKFDDLKTNSGWSPESEEFYRQVRAQFLDTMHELIAVHYAQVLGYLKRLTGDDR